MEPSSDEAKDRKYPLYTDIFADYEPQIPQISSDLFNLAYKRHKMGQIHKWIFPLMNTVSFLCEFDTIIILCESLIMTS